MYKSPLDKHISQQFEADLQQLKSQVLELGGVVQQQVAKAASAVETANQHLAEEVILTESSVDAMELSLDESCTMVLACHQPAASDLRLVLTVTKMAIDLERIGDEARKIAQMAIEMMQDVNIEQTEKVGEISQMSALVKQMVNLALDAFARFDPLSALEVAKMDGQVDLAYKNAIESIRQQMQQNANIVPRAINMLWVLRSLERIGDHTRNIAEHIIYLVRGLDVRHSSLHEIEQCLLNG